LGKIFKERQSPTRKNKEKKKGLFFLENGEEKNIDAQRGFQIAESEKKKGAPRSMLRDKAPQGRPIFL